MSRPAQPTPKQNFLQTAMLMIAIWLGIQLFMGSQNKGPIVFDKKPILTSADALAAIHTANAKLQDVTMASQLVPAYKQKLNEEKVKPDVQEEKELEVAIIQADTQLKGGLEMNDTNKIRLAFNTLQGLERRYASKSLWTMPVAVAPTKELPVSSWTGKGLVDQIRATLSERNKSDKIWGAIPGGYQAIDFLVHLTGAQGGFSYALAALFLALVVRAAVYPLTQKQLMFSRQMSQLTPRVNEIKKQYEGDQQTAQVKVMELYREYGINPLAGCWPAFIQMPLFLTVYQCMLHYQFEFTKGTFLWINPVTSRATHGFVAANLGQQDYILIFIYGVTMIISTLLMPVTDPTQVKQQRLMGVGMAVIFTGMMFTGAFPVVSAFVLYWTFTNLLATAQSLRSYRLPMPPLEKVNAPGGGVYPTAKGKGGKWQQIMDDMQRRMLEEQKKSIEQNPGKGGSNDDDLGGGSAKLKPQNGPKPIASGSTGTPAKHKPKKRQ